MNYTKIDLILIQAARRDKEILLECGRHELLVTRILGSLVLLTTAVGFFSGFYGSYVVYKSTVWSAIFGAGLAGAIYTLDGAILSYSFKTSVFATISRIVLALALSYFFSTMVIVGLFNDKIVEIQSRQLDVEIENAREIYTSKTKELNDSISSRKAMVDELQLAYLDEASGDVSRGGSGVRGYGKVTEMKEDAYRAELERFEEFKSKASAEIAKAEAEMMKQFGDLEQTQATGIFGRLSALMNTEDEWLHFWTRLIHLIFIGLDLSPLLLKLTKTGRKDLYPVKVLMYEEMIYQKLKYQSELDIQLQNVESENEKVLKFLEIENAYEDGLINNLLALASKESTYRKQFNATGLTPDRVQKYLDQAERIFNESVDRVTNVKKKAV